MINFLKRGKIDRKVSSRYLKYIGIVGLHVHWKIMDVGCLIIKLYIMQHTNLGGVIAMKEGRFPFLVLYVCKKIPKKLHLKRLRA